MGTMLDGLRGMKIGVIFALLSLLYGFGLGGVFGAAKDRKNKKTGGTSNVEKAKRKNLPLAARVKAAKKRRTSFVSKRVKDKQFKGRYRK